MDLSILFLIGVVIIFAVMAIGIPALAFASGYSIEETPEEMGYSATPEARIGGALMAAIPCVFIVVPTVLALTGGVRIGGRGEARD